jgi:hypothetical protein
VSAARFLLSLVVVALLLIGLFFAGAALAVGGDAVSIATSFVFAAALLYGFKVLQAQAYVESTGVVSRVRVNDLSVFRIADLTIRVDDPQVVVFTELQLHGDGSPAVGTRVRMLVPIHAPEWAVLVRDQNLPPLTGVTLLFGRRRHRIELGSWSWLAGRPVWQTMSAERMLDYAAELVSEVVLGWQRRRCEPLTVLLHKTPEFLALDAVFDVRWTTVITRALREQAAVFDATATRREAAAVALLPLPFFAAAGLALAAFVIPDVVRVLWAVLESLLAGSARPFVDTVHWSAAVAAAGLPSRDLYVALVCTAIALVGFAHGGIRSARRGRLAYRAWRTDLTEVLRDRLRAEYQRVANAQEPSVLLIRNAPGFAGVTADQVVARVETSQLRSLAFDLGAGAVAISGSRGVGKTTLLSALTEDHGPGTLGMMVSAPVRYEPRDFLLHLYAQLCHTVLARLGDQRARSRLRWAVSQVRRSVAWSLRAAAQLSLLAILFTGTRMWLGEHLPLPRLPATYLMMSFALFVLARWIRGPEPARELALAAEAARRLRQTRFLQTVSSEKSAGVGRSSMQAGWRRSRQWAEQPHSLPELVDSYRAFATDVAEWWRAETGDRGKLLIAIDEADRIADPQLAEQFVNEIKATFGIRHCVYLVSMSEEALTNFERRVVRMRTVFDSAFDHVVRLRPLTLRESVDLLRHRVAGVPDPFWILCHCMAGGMPRDVLRMARTMLDVHRESAGPSPLPGMAERLVALEVQAVKRGFQHQAAAEPDPVLPELLADAAWPGRSSEELRHASECQLASGSTAATAIAAAFLYYATVLQIFTAGPDIVRSWRVLLDERRPRQLSAEARLVADLASVHRLLAFDPAVAIQQLRGIRAGLGAE